MANQLFKTKLLFLMDEKFNQLWLEGSSSLLSELKNSFLSSIFAVLFHSGRTYGLKKIFGHWPSFVFRFFFVNSAPLMSAANKLAKELSARQVAF